MAENVENRQKRNDATPQTIQANTLVKNELPFDDQESFELASRGCKRVIPGIPVSWKNGDKQGIAWDPLRYNFVKGDAPNTVNPSLWRQSMLTNIGGLFEVVPGIYQIRNYDLANMTIIESEDGLILVDVLTSAETAKAALELYYSWKKVRSPVVAVIITHSHIDHFAGIIDGVATMQDIKSGRVKVYAPDGFVNYVYMENFYMGNAMGRRASYMYGNLLPADEKGTVGSGLGTTRAQGTVTMVPQEYIIYIKDTFEEKKIANIKFEFQLVPETEAPAEMHFFVNGYNALCTAENACHTMHNVYTLRGTAIRDALSWSKDLNAALQKWGWKSKVIFGVHHWPVWGEKEVAAYLKKQRDLYRYINDQTLRLANLGYKPVEIAEYLRQLSPDLEKDWDVRGYYGSLNHNVKSVYVKHLGWFDGNPATLHPYPPHKSGIKYVEYMGGAEALLAKAQKSYDEGDYRWVAEVINHLIFSYPEYSQYYEAAKTLQASALEQLGYQSECGVWRNFYLTGAQELRDGVKGLNTAPAGESFLLSVPSDIFFDYFGMLLKGQDVWQTTSVIIVVFNDTNEIYQLELENGALNHMQIYSRKPNDILTTIITERAVFYNLITGIAGGSITDPTKALQTAIKKGLIKTEGDINKFEYILKHLQTLNPNFNIIEPVDPSIED